MKRLTLEEQLQNLAFGDDGLTAYFLKNPHAAFQHKEGQNKEKPVCRCLDEHKKADGYFIESPINPKPMRAAIERVILDRYREIADWMRSNSKKDLILSFDPDQGLEEQIGIGVAAEWDQTRKHMVLIESECYDVEMILAKTDKGEGYEFAAFDFDIVMKTIYPNATAPSSVPTNRDLTPDIMASRSFKTADTQFRKQALLRMAGHENPGACEKQSQNRRPPGREKDPTASCLGLAEEIRSRSPGRADSLESP